MNGDLIAAFNQYFELVHADTDALRRQVYMLRYQIYALETGFEREEDCTCIDVAGGDRVCWEEDAFDARSDHFLIRHRRTNLDAATVRLILPNSQDGPYPTEQYCQLDSPVTDPETRSRLGEISRFAVSKEFKRRLGESGKLAGIAENVDMYFSNEERRVLPHISLGLFAAVVSMAHTHGIGYFYAVMEPALIRLLGRIGVVINRIGPEVEYHGMRVPCLIPLAESLTNINKVSSAVWDLITNRGEWS